MSDHIYLHVWNTPLRLSRSSQCYWDFVTPDFGNLDWEWRSLLISRQTLNPCFLCETRLKTSSSNNTCPHKFSAPANGSPSLFPKFRWNTESKLSLKGHLLDFTYSILLACYRCGIGLTLVRMNPEIKYRPVKDDCIAYCQTRSFESERGAFVIMPGC